MLRQRICFSWLLLTEAVIVLAVTRPSVAQSPEAGQPAYSLPGDSPLRGPFAWNRGDEYVAPDFDRFFPAGDVEAGRQLDLLLRDDRRREQMDPLEVLEIARRGLRTKTRYDSEVTTMVGNSFIWNREPQHPAAIEWIYHAAGSPNAGLAHGALYQGLTVVADRSENLMRMLMANYEQFDPEIQQRIHWGFKTYGDQERTAAQLRALLDDHANLGPDGTIAAYRAYEQLTGRTPPQPERFSDLGQWIVAFHHEEVPAFDPDAAGKLLEVLRNELAFTDQTDLVVRIDGEKAVAVVLMPGLFHRERLLDQIAGAEQVVLAFEFLLTERAFQTHRLREFLQHFPEPVSHAAPRYTPPSLEETYAWNRTDRYEPPDFHAFFPDDAAAGERLDDLYARRENLDLTDRELLDAVRQGLRRASVHPNALFSWFAFALGWPEDPLHKEIFYHAAGIEAPLETHYYAIYYGLRGWWDKSDNVLQMFADLYINQPERSRHDVRQWITWSLREEDEKQFVAARLATALEKHEELTFDQLVAIRNGYESLADNPPPNLSEFEDRGVFLIAFRIRHARNLEDAMERVRADFAASPYWIAEKMGPPFDVEGGAALVRGMAGLEWVVKRYEQEKDQQGGIILDFVAPWTASFVARMEEGNRFPEWEEYLAK